MRNSKALFYLDCAPSVGTNAGNLARLNSLNEFFLNSNIPFLNFSEGTITPRLFDWLVQPIIVSDAQARMNGPDTFIIEAKELAAQIALGKIPARVHYYYPTSHHLNIAKPSDRLEPTYYYTRIYVANWIQLRPPANNLHEIFNWDQSAYRIFSTVRVYAIVIESIVKNDPAATMITSTAREQVSGALIPLSASVTTVLRSMSINELLIALFSDALVAADVPGIRVVVAVVGRIGALFGVAVSLVTAEGLAARLNSYVRNLLRNNTDTLRQVVNLVSRYVMPDFRAALASDASQQELEATLNYLCRNVAQTICSVFLQPTSPHTTFESPDLIRGATIAHHDLLFQAEIVVNQLPSLLQGTTEIRTDGDEDRVRTILTPQFIRDVLRRDVNPAPV
ncbi:unnamed protein product [Didymodactylos carnosus]|uniref:Uncharacterized protein n=1 Tax=Didymodactylos carnosus TaxID=1234261 RepID=A0A8S2TEW5_9BILA|nr:unnamed protein product [Didymodactylos carnosus]CAF4285700.1 unnamed protein product [Didymodactylos carnosus]